MERRDSIKKGFEGVAGNLANTELFSQAAGFFQRRVSTLSDGSMQQQPGSDIPRTPSATADVGSTDAGATSLAGRRPEDIPKEELLHLCMKLSKRLKVVETRATQLATVFKDTQAERVQLWELAELLSGAAATAPPPPGISSDPNGDNNEGNGTSSGGLNLEHFKASWRRRETEHAELVSSLRNAIEMEANLREEAEKRMKAMGRIVESQTPPPAQRPSITDADASDKQQSCEEQETIDGTLSAVPEGQIVESSSSDVANKERENFLQSRIESLQRELDSAAGENASLKSTVVRLQLELETERRNGAEAVRQVHAANEKAKVLRMEAEASVTALTAERDKAARGASAREEELVLLRLQTDAARRGEAQAKASAAQAEAEATKLREEAVSVDSARQSLAIAQEKASILAAKAATAEVLRDEIDIAQTQLAERNATITRLRVEMETMQQSHATRVASFAAIEAESEAAREHAQEMIQNAENCKAEVALALQQCEMYKADCERHQAELIACNNAVMLAKNAVLLESEAAEKAARSAMEAEKRAQEMELALVEAKSEAARRSQAARELIAERDRQVALLQAQLEEQDHFGGEEKGLLAEPDPRLLKLANAQRLSETSSLDRRRATVIGNGTMDHQYLKNVILEFMCMSTTSSERAALVPVLATLLQFSEEERAKVGSGFRFQWFGGTTKEIKVLKRRGSQDDSSTTGTTHPRNSFS